MKPCNTRDIPFGGCLFFSSFEMPLPLPPQPQGGTPLEYRTFQSSCLSPLPQIVCPTPLWTCGACCTPMLDGTLHLPSLNRCSQNAYIRRLRKLVRFVLCLSARDTESDSNSSSPPCNIFEHLLSADTVRFTSNGLAHSMPRKSRRSRTGNALCGRGDRHRNLKMCNPESGVPPCGWGGRGSGVGKVTDRILIFLIEFLFYYW